MRDRLKELIEELGISIREFTREAGISQGSINDVLNGRSESLSGKTLSAIRERYDVSPLWLLTGEGGMFIGEPPMPTDASPEERALLRMVRSNPELMRIFKGIGTGTTTFKQMVEAVEHLPEPKRKTALKLIQALEG